MIKKIHGRLGKFFNKVYSFTKFLALSVFLICAIAAYAQVRNAQFDSEFDARRRITQLEINVGINTQQLKDIDRRLAILDAEMLTTRIARLETIAEINLGLIVTLVLEAIARLFIWRKVRA